MPKKGVRYFRFGRTGLVKVGFFYHEVVYAHIKKHPEGKRISEIASATKIKYNTVRKIVNQLREMNRIQPIPRKIRQGRDVDHWIVTQWSLKNLD